MFIPLAWEDGPFFEPSSLISAGDDPAGLPFFLALFGTDPSEKEHHSAPSIPYYIWIVWGAGLVLPYSNRNWVLFLLLKIIIIVVLISFPANC